ncbi:unnamed protein product, partial [Prunus brigantina]
MHHQPKHASSADHKAPAFLHAANAANVSTHPAQTSNWGEQSQSFHAPPQFSNSQSSQLNPSNGPSAKGLQQPAHAMSIMNANRVFGNNNSYANALGL